MIKIFINIINFVYLRLVYKIPDLYIDCFGV